MFCSRRKFTMGMAGAFAAGCTDTAKPPGSSSETRDPVVSETFDAVGERRTVKPPQCLIGLPDVPAVTVLAASLHCTDSRAWIRKHRESLKAEILAGTRGLHLTHLARTANEVPVVVELMKVREDVYPEALLGALTLAADLDRPLSLGHINAYMEENGFEREKNLRTDDLIFSVMATQRAFHENLDLRETPYVAEISS